MTKKRYVVRLLITLGSAVVAFITDHIVSSNLENEKLLSKEGKFLVSVFCALLVFQILEWLIFSFLDWMKTTTELDKFQTKFNSFEESWNAFQKEWNTHKLEISNLGKSRSRTGAILDKFAKSNVIVESLSEKIKDDLELDEKITLENDLVHKEFHSFISTLKYMEFFASHFIINAAQKAVLQIPSYYFKNRIWTEFVDKANHYYSVEKLDGTQSKIYLKDEKRLDDELDFLTKKIDDENKTEIKKIFVVNKMYFDGKKIKDTEIKMKCYLTKWNERFKEKQDLIEIKIINESIAHGVYKKIGEKVDDIGIFGDVYGVQTVNPKDTKFYTDELKIDFYFDKEQTQKQILNFKELLKKAIPLDSVL
jgi:hypothetical protein